MNAEAEHTVEKMLKMRTIVLLGALLPGAGCYLCIAYTYAFQFDKVLNFTQGQVCHSSHNFLPPVSYSIGVWEPQRFFWLLVMFLHLPPRMTFLVLYRRLFLQTPPSHSWFATITSIYTVTMWIEIWGLITVTVFPVKLFWVHSTGYTFWITAFNLNILQSVILHHYGGVRAKLEWTFWLKVFFLVSIFSLTLSTAISFPIFVNYCYDPAYTAFSFAEYALVGLNSAYYCLMYWEFPKTRITIGVRVGPHPRKIATQLSQITCCTELEEDKEPV